MKKIIAFFILVGLLTVFIPNVNSIRADDSFVPVYSFWSKPSSYRFLTHSKSEIKSLTPSSGWENEGIMFYAYSAKQDNTVPIYRIKNSTYSYYYYTASKEKRDSLIKTKGWTDKGIAFYAYDSKKENTTPVYALKNSKTSKYFYASSPGEKKCMLSNSAWTDKGASFWIPKENANVSEDETACRESYGPEISVGLWNYTSKDLKNSAFKIDSNKDYVVKDRDGDIIFEVSAKKTTKVKYDGDKDLLAYGAVKNRDFSREISFEAKDGNNSNIVFDVYRPGSDYDQYRGKIKIRYTDSDNIWVINTLPMEQYAWGMGETTGTGPIEHTKVMATIFRTYGYWYKEYATKYLKYGFTIRSDSGSQIYRGYDWEKKYPNIKKAVGSTKGTIVKYKNEIALTPYSSWSDGKTRSFEERWGSDDYPWCQSVKDPYGKNPSLSTKKLEAAGNHMVGLIANGSVKLAGSSYKKKYDWILKYYYSKVSLAKMY